MSATLPKIPPHLANLKIEAPLSKHCKWALSGPQFPQPTAMQQRYCYPVVGESYYSKTQGGTLWTMYNCEGEEEKEYRLLHVYYSPKRAKNNLNAASTSAGSNAEGKKKQKPKRKRDEGKKNRKPKRKRATSKTGKGTKKSKPSVSSESCSKLPGALSSSSPCSIRNQIFRNSKEHASPDADSASSVVIQRDLSNNSSIGGSFGHNIYPVPTDQYNDGFLPAELNQTFQNHPSGNNSPVSDNSCDPLFQPPSDLARDFDMMLGVPLADPSSLIIEPSNEWAALTDAADLESNFSCRSQTNGRFPQVLVEKLEAVHKEIIHEWIGSRPRSERGRLISVVANWARSISRSPLDIQGCHDGEKGQSDSLNQSDGKNMSSKVDDWAVAV
jgi:hypothetical protein